MITNPIFNDQNLQLLLKVITLVLLGIYGIFAFIIVRQGRLMGQTLQTPLTPTVKFVSLLHAFLVIGLIGLALLML